MEMQKFKGNQGLVLAADVAGTPPAPSIILLHGGGQTRHSWGRLARHLARQGYHVISLDSRGHGDSEWAPDGDYSLSAFTEDLRCVIRELPQPPVLIGASLGGLSALLAVGEADEAVASGLVLVDVVPRLEPAGVRRIREFMLANIDGFESIDAVVDAVSAYLPHRPQPPTPDGLKKNLREGANGKLYWHWDPIFMTSDRRPTVASELERLQKAARHVHVPALVVRGKLSDIVSQEGADEFLELMPDARVVEVAGAGHMVAGDKNDAFNMAIEAFLAELFDFPVDQTGA